MAPERIQIVTQYILEHFDQKTYRGDKTYIYNTLTNIAEVASAKKGRGRGNQAETAYQRF